MDLSYCIPSYQRFESACRTVDSCLVEITSGVKAEVLLLDDASPDGTGKKLAAYYKKNKHVKVVTRKKNIGLVANWNDGLRRARGQWVQFLGDDDQVAGGSADICLNTARQNPDLAFLFSGFDVIDSQGKGGQRILPLPGGEGLWPGEWLWAWVTSYFSNIALCTVLFNRKKFSTLGGFRPQAAYAADGDALLRMLADGKAFYLDRPLARNGWSGDNLQVAMKDIKTSQRLKAIAAGTKIPVAWEKIPGVRQKLEALLVGRHAADSVLRWYLQKKTLRAAEMETVMARSQAALPSGPWQRSMNLARLAANPALRPLLLLGARLVWRARRRWALLRFGPQQSWLMLDKLFKKTGD